jgi:mRNA interferase RelE/StbE
MRAACLLALDQLALHGRDGIRLRVGSWRVIMIDGEILEVLDIGPRGSIY